MIKTYCSARPGIGLKNESVTGIQMDEYAWDGMKEAYNR